MKWFRAISIFVSLALCVVIGAIWVFKPDRPAGVSGRTYEPTGVLASMAQLENELERDREFACWYRAWTGDMSAGLSSRLNVEIPDGPISGDLDSLFAEGGACFGVEVENNEAAEARFMRILGGSE